MAAELSPRDINSRFKHYGPPFPLPGKCCVCGNVRTPVVDFGASVDGFGAVLMCENCVVEAYNILVRDGAVEVPQSTPVEEYTKIADDLKEALSDTVSSITNLFDASDGLLRGITHEVALRSDEDSSGTDGEKPSGPEGTDEQISDNAGDKGPASVPSSRVRKSVLDGI